jgi:hypothetical protein
MQIDSAPVAGTNATINNAIALRVLTGVSTGKGIIVQGAVSQARNLQEWQNSSGAALGYITSSGNISFARGNGGSEAFGDFANASGSSSTALGYFAVASGTETIALGYSSSASASTAIALGKSATASASNAIAIGTSVSNSTANSVAIGNSSNTLNAFYGTLRTYMPSAATTGAIIRGFTSQSANLQEWQNSAGTALASVDASGNISAASILTDGGYKSSYTAEYVFIRAAPTTVGNYVEICNFDEQRTAMQIMAVSETGSGIGTTHKIYNFASAYGTGRNTILTPITMARQSGYESTFDFEIEAWSDGTNFRLRLRRTAGTSARNVAIYIKNLNINGISSLTSATGTGTSSISAAYGYGVNGAYLSAPPVIGTSGAGNSVSIYGSSAAGTGAGGSVILQPGAQATSGGDGVIQIKSAAGVNSGKLQGSTGDLKIIPESGKNVLIYDGYNGGGTNVIFQTNQSGSEPRVNMGYGVSINSFNFISGSVYAGNYASLTSWNLNLGFRATGGGYAVQSGITGGSAGVLNVTEGDFSAGGSIAFKSSSPSGYAANQDNLVLTGSAFQRLSGTAARDITGVAPPSGGSHVDGRMMRLFNIGTFNLTLKHNSTSSTAANRFFCATATDIILATNDFAELIYDSTNNGSGAAGWRVV